MNQEQKYDITKLPPQAVELEEAVLGGIMLQSDAFSVVEDILTAEMFYKEAHQRIWRAIMRLKGKGAKIDILLVVQELKATGELELAGNAYYISMLTSRIASASNIEFHARIIAEKAMKREMITVCSETITQAYDEGSDVFDLSDKMATALKTHDLLITGGKHPRILADHVSDEQKQYSAREAASNKNEIIGIPTGFHELNMNTAGWQNSDLIIIAARPGMGKTSLMLHCAKEAGSAGAIFSLEMSAQQLTSRMVVSDSDVDAHRYKLGKLFDSELEVVQRTRGELERLPIFIDDTPALPLSSLRAKARRMKAQHNIKWVMVDYLQLMSTGEKSKYGNREQEISTISRGLKAIAKELDIPVIALSQLSRAVEQRGGDKRPQLSDLRESGAIEQDADIVIFIHRPEYYGMTEDAGGNSTIGACDLIIAKHRNGGLGDIPVKFIERNTKFIDEKSQPFSPGAGLQPNQKFQEEPF